MNWRDEKRTRRHEFVTRRDEDFVQDLTAYPKRSPNSGQESCFTTIMTARLRTDWAIIWRIMAGGGGTPDFNWQGQKMPGPKCNSRKIRCRISKPQKFPEALNDITRKIEYGIRGNYYESSDCFEYPQKSLLKSSYPQKYFSTSKKSRNRKKF